MKKIIGWLTMGIFVLAAMESRAQTTNVDYLTLRIQVALMCLTNADSGGDVAETGSARLNSKDLIQLLSDKLSFTLNKFTNGDGVVAPQRGPGAHPTHSSKATLLLMQPLGTNHGEPFIVIRDGRPAVDYIVNDYFSFSKRGFENLTNQVVRGNANLNNPEYAAIYITDIAFDNQANSDGGDRVAFEVDGKAKERRGPVNVKHETIDSDVIKDLKSDVTGTGSLTGHFTVVTGSINASGPVKESK
jgi:hypothetical protein